VSGTVGLVTSSSVTGDRRLPFAGATNFRDLGGYATRDGGVTRWGLVYRSDGLQQLTDDDIAHYDQLGIRVVYDLRRDDEREQLPNRVESVGLCIMTPVTEAGIEPFDRSGAADQRDGERLLRNMYGRMLEHSGRVIGTMFGGLASRSSLPAVFHCHAGKDRTGLVAALLLEALGVDRQLVLDDYELTSMYRLREHQEQSFERLVDGGMVPEAAAGVLGAPRWAMEETLDQLDAQFGGIEAYLFGVAGLDVDTLDRLRRQLVDPWGAAA
jgi:protein-tyrosine phosphatase